MRSICFLLLLPLVLYLLPRLLSCNFSSCSQQRSWVSLVVHRSPGSLQLLPVRDPNWDTNVQEHSIWLCNCCIAERHVAKSCLCLERAHTQLAVHRQLLPQHKALLLASQGYTHCHPDIPLILPAVSACSSSLSSYLLPKLLLPNLLLCEASCSRLSRCFGSSRQAGSVLLTAWWQGLACRQRLATAVFRRAELCS